ncbi:MAG: NADH-quinone oxidoreductase subunit NuoF [Candidatus Brocadiia bacterium]
MQQQAREKWEGLETTDQILVRVGAGTCGRAAGALGVLDAARRELKGNGTDGIVSSVGCIGLCYAEPLVELSAPGTPTVLYGDVQPEDVAGLLAGHVGAGEFAADKAVAVMNGKSVEDVPVFSDHPMQKGQFRIVLRNCGIIDPENIDHYLARDGYAGLKKALSMDSGDVVEEVKKSGLRGRGGAGFPTGVKWGFCRDAEGETKYLICNADEGDPGAFMDRAVLESDPHSVIEGMVIAAYAIGADHGYIYVRAEYPLAIARLEKAIADANERNLLGDDILGSGFDFEIQLKKGAGAFVCGEETALLASIEGRRGMPRTRPPFPAQEGLWGHPTNINNVETLANVPRILLRGADWFAERGTEKSRGTKTFALAGKIQRTGLIEVPLGTPLREVVFDIGGGIPDEKEFKAVQTGGPSGGCIPASLLDLPVDYEKLTEAGSIMGSGGMVVMDEDTCMVDIARYFDEFTQKESCGKCVPCRLGTRQMLNILTRISEGQGKEGDVELLEQIARSVKLGSLCGLGQTAPNPVLTTIRYFRDEYETHVFDKECPAGVCSNLLGYEIDPDVCICCGRCASECPVDCITGEKGKPPSKATEEDRAEGKVGHPFVIGQDECVKCGTCFDVCPVGAVERK